MFEKDMERIRCLNVQQEFVSRIFDGETISEAAALMRLNPAVIGITMRDNVDFANGIRQAQEFRVDIMVDKLEHIREYESNPLMAGVISKNIQWLASKRLRSMYGDKMDVNHNVTINIRAAMDAARERVTIEHEPKLLIDNINATDSTSVALDEIDPLS